MSTTTWKEFMVTSTIHGLRDIVSSKNQCERAVFIFSLLICNGFSLFGIVRIVKQYHEMEPATTYFIKENGSLKLPDVTICPFNRLDRDFLFRHDISVELGKYIELVYFFVNPIYDFVEKEILKQAHRDMNSQKIWNAQLNAILQKTNMSLEQFLEAAGIPCTSLFLRCEQQYMPFECCQESQVFMTSLGRCYRVSGRDQIGSGFGMGASYTLHLPLERFVASENMLMNDGVLLKLTENNKGYEFDAIFVPTGVHALLQLRATKLDFINDPGRFSCRENSSEHYAPFLCFQECLLWRAHKECKCRYAGLPVHDMSVEGRRLVIQLPVCTPHQTVHCLYNWLQYSNTHDKEYHKKCLAKCETRCKYWQYRATVSYAKYPSRSTAGNYFRGSTTQKDVEIESLESTDMIIELFYDKLEYTLIKQYPSMTADQLVANLGGQIGLWMGGSILSIVHLMVFLCTWLQKKATMGAQLIKTPNGDAASPGECVMHPDERDTRYVGIEKTKHESLYSESKS